MLVYPPYALYKGDLDCSIGRDLDVYETHKIESYALEECMPQHWTSDCFDLFKELFFCQYHE